MGRILIADDQVKVRRDLASILHRDQHEISEVASVQEARRSLATKPYDAVFATPKMVDGKGQTVFRAARDSDPTVSVVFLAASSSSKLGVELYDTGVDFLAKPFRAVLVRGAAIRACERTRVLRENDLLKRMITHSGRASVLDGKSPAIRDVQREIARLANSNACVLITGEIGTGKEAVAREIHRHGPRARKPFIVVNCGSIAEPQLESELFGSEKSGSGEDAPNRRGLFEAAHEGTLFLDEAARMPPQTQIRLLRILADSELLRLASSTPRMLDVRVLVGTRHNLEQRVRDGLFRADLLDRLAVVRLRVPPLRDRREDIPGLCDMFSQEIATELKLPYKRIGAQAIEELQSHSFPGNLRELRNWIEHVYILSTHDEIAPADLRFPQGEETLSSVSGSVPGALPGRASSLPDFFDLNALLEQTEKELIVRTLDATGWAQAAAARRMGVPRSVLAYKLSKYKLRSQSGSGPKHQPG